MKVMAGSDVNVHPDTKESLHCYAEKHELKKIFQRSSVDVGILKAHQMEISNGKVLTKLFSTFEGNNFITLDESDAFITETQSSNSSISFADTFNNNKGYTLRVGDWCAAYLTLMITGMLDKYVPLMEI